MSREAMTDNSEKKLVKKEANLPSELTAMFEADAGMGLENMGADDVKIPFIRILQDLSPQVKEGKGEYVQGAKPGMIINSVSKKLYDGSKGINVLRCYYKREYVEWKDRGKGESAPVATYSANDDIIHTANRDQLGKDRLPNGNYLANTANHYVLMIDDNKVTESALIAMSFSQLVKSREWNTMITSNKHMKKDGTIIKPPAFSHVYNLRTVLQSNSKGEFYNWSITKVGPLTDSNTYQTAKKFSEGVSKGAVSAKYEEEKVNESSDSPY